MDKIRITHKIDPKLNHDCDSIHIESYEMEEVILPAAKKEKPRKAIRIVLRGRNFKAVAQPLFVLIGKDPLRYLRIAPDERSVEGILLKEPEQGANIDVILGDQEHVRHPEKLDLAKIKRI